MQVAPSGYYAHKGQAPSAHAARDRQVLEHIVPVHGSRRLGRSPYDARQVWHQLTREGVQVTGRPGDLVNRHFTADAPNRLWVMDFTYVPT